MCFENYIANSFITHEDLLNIYNIIYIYSLGVMIYNVYNNMCIVYNFNLTPVSRVYRYFV
jgi:hypothetical protein